MAKLTILGVKTSPPCRAVFLTAKALGVDLKFEHVDMTDDKHKTNSELKKHNILTTVPVLVIDSGDKSVVDSHAINTYLINSRDTEHDLYPKDAYKRAQIDRMLHFDSGVLFPRLDVLFRVQCYTKDVAPLDHQKVEHFLEGLSMLEEMLKNKTYLCDNHVTLADLTCVATVSSAIGVISQIDKNKYSNVLKWIANLEKLAYYQEANGKGAKELSDYVKKRLEEHENQKMA